MYIVDPITKRELFLLFNGICIHFVADSYRSHSAIVFFFFFSFAYTTSPAAVKKLVVFFRSSKHPYIFW